MNVSSAVRFPALSALHFQGTSGYLDDLETRSRGWISGMETTTCRYRLMPPTWVFCIPSKSPNIWGQSFRKVQYNDCQMNGSDLIRHRKKHCYVLLQASPKIR